MPTDALTISIDEPLKTFVLREAIAAGFRQPGDYVLALINGERRRKADLQLEGLLREGLESGPAVEADDAYWKSNRSKVGLPPRR